MRALLSILLGLCALLVTGCGEEHQPITYRYRMTVEVETPQGLRTGSSIIEVRTIKGIAFPGPEAASLQVRIRGEAVAVDLPRGQTLFALLSRLNFSDQAARIPEVSLQPDPPFRGGGDAWRKNIEALKRIRNSASVPPNEYPLLVRFRDIHDPKSVEAVDPGDLAASFGKGVKLRRIVIQITEDPVTTGIEKRLGWLRSLRGGGTLRGAESRDYVKLERNLNYTAFVRGSKK